MATPTYTLIDSVTLGSSASTVTFTNISPTGKGDLVLVINCQGNNSRVEGHINSDTGTNYSYVNMQAAGTAAESYNDTGLNYFHAGLIRGSTKSLNIVNIMDFSATDKHTTILSRENNAAYRVFVRSMRWANTAAVTSLTLSPAAYAFDSGSTFHLYQLVSE